MGSPKVSIPTVMTLARGLAVLLENFAGTNAIQFMICRTQTIPYYSLNATLFGFEPIVICIFPSFFSCYFSRNQNGKGSSYGLLFSHVETILVMVSKESLAVSGISQRSS